MKCQIAIVGGGPGGLSAALAACRAGAQSVVVIERKQQWGRPVQCGGYVPRVIRRTVPFDGRAVKASVETLAVFLDGEMLRSIRAPGYILRRDVLEEQMAQAAMDAGATCLQPARALDVGDGWVTVEAKGERREIEAEIIIAADGPQSLTRRAMGLPEPKLAVGLAWELPLAAPLDAAEIHLSPEYGAGYGWVFPAGETAGVGLALDVDGPGRVKDLLADFVARMVARGVLRDSEPASRVSGLIPVNGPLEQTVLGSMALVGDAAGQTNPLTGAGIMSAVTCGDMAGAAAAAGVSAADPGRLLTYETAWRGLLGGFLDRALRGRSRMARAGADDFPDVARKAWHLGKPNAALRGGTHPAAQ